MREEEYLISGIDLGDPFIILDFDKGECRGSQIGGWVDGNIVFEKVDKSDVPEGVRIIGAPDKNNIYKSSLFLYRNGESEFAGEIYVHSPEEFFKEPKRLSEVINGAKIQRIINSLEPTDIVICSVYRNSYLEYYKYNLETEEIASLDETLKYSMAGYNYQAVSMFPTIVYVERMGVSEKMFSIFSSGGRAESSEKLATMIVPEQLNRIEEEASSVGLGIAAYKDYCSRHNLDPVRFCKKMHEQTKEHVPKTIVPYTPKAISKDDDLIKRWARTMEETLGSKVDTTVQYFLDKYNKEDFNIAIINSKDRGLMEVARFQEDGRLYTLTEIDEEIYLKLLATIPTMGIVERYTSPWGEVTVDTYAYVRGEGKVKLTHESVDKEAKVYEAAIGTSFAASALQGFDLKDRETIQAAIELAQGCKHVSITELDYEQNNYFKIHFDETPEEVPISLVTSRIVLNEMNQADSLSK